MSDAATVGDPRVLIARDVLALLDSGRVEAINNHYLVEEEGREYDPSAQASEALAGLECSVCALGGLFLATIYRFNDYSMKALGVTESYQFLHASRERLLPPLLKHFSRSQLDLIETAFEGFRSSTSLSYDSPAVRRAVRFNAKYNSDDARLRAILNNIIDNDGAFKP